MATLLMRIKRSRNRPEAGIKAKEIQHLLQKLDPVCNVDSLRGYEGKGSAIYFQGFRHGFVAKQAFAKRVRRPPTDPVNAVLSLVYTFLINRVYAAVRVTGLDPYPGVLHKIDYGRYSLVLDLVEEFRTIIADTLTLSLFNLKILKPDDFQTEIPPERSSEEMETIPDVSADPIGMISPQNDSMRLFDIPDQRIDSASATTSPITGKYPVRLTPDAFSKVIESFEKKMMTSFFYPPADRELTYAEALVYQAAHYRKVVEGEVDLYQPILFK